MGFLYLLITGADVCLHLTVRTSLLQFRDGTSHQPENLNIIKLNISDNDMKFQTVLLNFYAMHFICTRFSAS